MPKILFATTNEHKLREAREILDMEVESVSLEIDEIQSLDPEEVARKKARAYFAEVQQPLFVEDVSLTFHDLDQLPGTYIDDFLKSIGNEGLVDLLNEDADREATAQTTLVYIDDKGEEHVFIGTVHGEITTTPSGDYGFGWDPIFIPEGDDGLTFGEMDSETKSQYSMRAMALRKFKSWLEEQG